MYREIAGISGMTVCLSTQPQGRGCMAVLLSDAPKMGHVAQASAKLAQDPVCWLFTLRHRVISQVVLANTTETADVQITYSDVHARLNDSPNKATRVSS